MRGAYHNPLAPDEATYLLWILMGYSLITATLLVSFGRLSDMFGRVLFYNLGFVIFTVGSILLSLVPNAGYLKLQETNVPNKAQRLDLGDNQVFLR
jgi:MFS family permease